MEQGVGTTSPGNTRTGSVKRRSYFVTIWNDQYPRDLPENCSYLITCDDETEAGQYHAHGFVYFKNPVTLRSVKKLFGDDCHAEKPFSNSHCIAYVRGEIEDPLHKKHNIIEHGVMPMDNGIKRTVHDLKDVADPGELDWRQYNTWVKIHSADDIDVDDLHKDVEVYFISGPSGSGKTEMAKQIIRDQASKYGTKLSLVKYDGNFWHGVHNNGCIALYDEFRDSHMKPSEFINFIDYNVQPMNVKGGTVYNKYRLIILTSVQRLDQLYMNVSGEPRKQWVRRVKEINLNVQDDDSTADIDIDQL